MPRSTSTARSATVLPFTVMVTCILATNGDADWALAESRVFGHGTGEQLWMVWAVDVPPVVGHPAAHTLQSRPPPLMPVFPWRLMVTALPPIVSTMFDVHTGSCTLGPGVSAKVEYPAPFQYLMVPLTLAVGAAVFVPVSEL